MLKKIYFLHCILNNMRKRSLGVDNSNILTRCFPKYFLFLSSFLVFSFSSFSLATGIGEDPILDPSTAHKVSGIEGSVIPPEAFDKAETVEELLSIYESHRSPDPTDERKILGVNQETVIPTLLNIVEEGEVTVEKRIAAVHTLSRVSHYIPSETTHILRALKEIINRTPPPEEEVIRRGIIGALSEIAMRRSSPAEGRIDSIDLLRELLAKGGRVAGKFLVTVHAEVSEALQKIMGDAMFSKLLQEITEDTTLPVEIRLGGVDNLIFVAMNTFGMPEGTRARLFRVLLEAVGDGTFSDAEYQRVVRAVRSIAGNMSIIVEKRAAAWRGLMGSRTLPVETRREVVRWINGFISELCLVARHLYVRHGDTTDTILQHVDCFSKIVEVLRGIATDPNIKPFDREFFGGRIHEGVSEALLDVTKGPMFLATEPSTPSPTRTHIIEILRSVIEDDGLAGIGRRGTVFLLARLVGEHGAPEDTRVHILHTLKEVTSNMALPDEVRLQGIDTLKTIAISTTIPISINSLTVDMLQEVRDNPLIPTDVQARITQTLREIRDNGAVPEAVRQLARTKL